MTRGPINAIGAALVAALFAGCGDDGAAETASNTSAASTTSTSGSTSSTGGDGGGTSSGGSGGAAACDDVQGMIEAYTTAHPGKDGDINTKTEAELANDPEAQALMALCGSDQRPVIPRLAWEYGGNDHAWIHPEASALYCCVYIPANPSTDHWQYDADMDHVTADVYIGCPELNPCKDMQGAD